MGGGPPARMVTWTAANRSGACLPHHSRSVERLKGGQRPCPAGAIFGPRADLERAEEGETRCPCEGPRPRGDDCPCAVRASPRSCERSTMSTRELAPEGVSTAPPPPVP